MTYSVRSNSWSHSHLTSTNIFRKPASLFNGPHKIYVSLIFLTVVLQIIFQSWFNLITIINEQFRLRHRSPWRYSYQVLLLQRLIFKQIAMFQQKNVKCCCFEHCYTHTHTHTHTATLGKQSSKALEESLFQGKLRRQLGSRLIWDWCVCFSNCWKQCWSSMVLKPNRLISVYALLLHISQHRYKEPEKIAYNCNVDKTWSAWL